jgi:hypothetical protein
MAVSRARMSDSGQWSELTQHQSVLCPHGNRIREVTFRPSRIATEPSAVKLQLLTQPRCAHGARVIAHLSKHFRK